MPSIDKKAIASELSRDSSLVVSSFKRFSADKCTALAASIAFYSAFSLAPTLLMVIAVAGWFFGEDAARGEIFSRAHDFLGNDAAAAIQAIVENAHQRGGNGVAAILSLVLLAVGASATFSSLNTALDTVFPSSPDEKRSGVALMIRVRLISFGLVLGVAFLLVVSLVLDTAVSFIGQKVWANTSFVIVGDVIQVVISLAILAVAFGALLKFLPDAFVPWRDALLGGAVSALLFTIGKKLFALYLAHAGTASAFGAAGSLAVLLMWLYFSSAVLLLGGEFAAVRSRFDERRAAAIARRAEHAHATAGHPAGDAVANGPGTFDVTDRASQRIRNRATKMAGEIFASGHHEDVDLDALDTSAAARAAVSPAAAAALREAASTESIQPPAASAIPAPSRPALAAGDLRGRRANRAAWERGVEQGLPLKGRAVGKTPMALIDRGIDRFIGRSKHPAVYRIMLKGAPFLIQGVSLLMPKRGAATRGARAAVNPPVTPRRAGTRQPARSRSPLTAALFAAGAGLAVASIFNRDKR